MNTKITVKYLYTERCHRFVISVLQAGQEEKEFIFADGIRFRSREFDILMGVIFNVPFCSQRLDYHIVSVGLPLEYESVLVVTQLGEEFTNHSSFMEKFDQMLVSVAESVKGFKRQQLCVGVIELDI